MPIYFADSSALLKRYRKESGSLRVLDVLENSERIFISRLAAVEVSGALTRRAKATNFPHENLAVTLALLDADLAKSVEIIELDRPLMEQAVVIARRHALRGADAVHLATVLFTQRQSVDREIILLSSDLELNAAATAEGLQVENPDLHP